MSPAWAALKPPMISEYLTIQDLYSQQSRIYTHNNPGFYTHNNPGFILTTIQDLNSQRSRIYTHNNPGFILTTIYQLTSGPSRPASPGIPGIPLEPYCWYVRVCVCVSGGGEKVGGRGRRGGREGEKMEDSKKEGERGSR